MIDIQPKMRMIGTLQLSRAQVLMIVTDYLKTEKQLGVVKANFNPTFEDVVIEVESLDDLPTRGIPVEKEVEIHNVKPGFKRPFYGIGPTMMQILADEFKGDDSLALSLKTLKDYLAITNERFATVSQTYIKSYLRRPDFQTKFTKKYSLRVKAVTKDYVRVVKL